MATARTGRRFGTRAALGGRCSSIGGTASETGNGGPACLSSRSAQPLSRTLFFAPSAAERVRAAISRARGNEVCFAARVGDGGEVYDPQVVSRGNRSAVLAATRGLEPGTLVVHNHPSGRLEPSDPDLEIAAELHGMGLGLAITDNDAGELYVVVAPAELKEYDRIEEHDVAAALAPGGPVSRAHTAYEDRPTQRDMAASIARAYNGGGIEVAEAGTGTGKSIAYLIPAIRWARANRERTIVSTNTINLQEQLVDKDLPFLRRALGEPFTFALVKGRRNYISIRRAHLAAATAGTLFDDSQKAELDSLVEWTKTTRDGSRQDLPFAPSAEVWDEVASESDVCLRTKCPHFEQCFYQRARRDAATADILVVNHHLLFSDIAVRRAAGNYTAPAVLPPYRRVVLDEAHNLEDAATSHLGAKVSRRGLNRLFRRMDRRGKGVLRAVETRLKAGQDDLLQQDALKEIDDRIRPAVARAREVSTELFDRLAEIVERTPDGVVRLAEGFAGEQEWIDRVQPAQENLVIAMDRLAKGLERLREKILMDDRWAEALDEQLLELQALAGRTRAAVDGLRMALAPGRDEIPMVRWLERRGRTSGSGSDRRRSGRRDVNVAANAAPVDLSDALRESLFERMHTTVLTSATLATQDGFGFLRRRLGLGQGLGVAESVHPSPFDYETQTVVAIPTDLPPPNAGEAFDEATTDVVADLAAMSDGGVFALFTSYRSLRNVAARLRKRRVDAEWPLFVQGEGPRARLIERFAQSGRGILLGVASFWEGVDVPGEPLRGLVIAKLPFKVPGEPLTAARTEAIERDGGNAFYDYMLPHAALRLKQGFGRLIRSRTDRGAIVLLDRRVVEKRYGRYFLETLPPAPVRSGGWGELKQGLLGFYRPDG